MRGNPGALSSPLIFAAAIAILTVALLSGYHAAYTHDGAGSLALNMSSAAATASRASRDSVVIFLHGLGDNGRSWSWMSSKYAKRLPHTRWITPTSPSRPITVNGGARMTGWFDLDDLPVTAHTPDDAAGYAASIALVHGMLDAEVARGVDSRRILLGGFSQGGAMTLAAGLRYDKPLGGLMVCAGWLPLLPEWPGSIHAAQADTPLFLAHGTRDDKVLFSLGQAAREKLMAAGHIVTWMPLDGYYHEYPSEAEAGVADFVADRLVAAGGV